LNKAAAKYDSDMAAGKTTRYSATPLVDEAIRQLSIYRLIDLRYATNATLQSPFEDDKLIEHTEVILYHSVFTVVLDRTGNPFDLRTRADRGGLLDYGLLLPPPGSQMKRALPRPGGLNVSVQHAGDTTFHIEEGKVTKVLFGGVGGFQEYGYGYSGKHELQTAIESFLANRGRSYIASVSAEAAFNSEEMSLGRIYLRLYDLAEAATPYVVKEIEARAKKMIVNWQEYAGSIIKGAIEQIIISEVKERVKAYLVKKIGKRIVPVVNAAFALYDLAAGYKEHKHMRYAIACAVLAIKGRTAEDTELSAKVVSKVLADEFEEKIIEKLIEHAAKAGKRLILHKANEKVDPKQQQPAANKSEAGAKPADDKSAQKAVADKAAVDHKQPVQESAADAEARRQANVYVREKLAEAVEASKAATAPAAAAAKADPRAIHDTGASDANRGKGDPGTALAPAAPKIPKPTPDYWPGTGMHGPPTRAQMGLGPPRPPRAPGSAARRPTAPPQPPGQTIHIKEEPPPEDLRDIRTQLNPRIGGPRSDVRVLRDNLAKKGTPVPPGHAAHHVAFKDSGGATGVIMHDTLRNTGISINVGDNGVAARGTPAAPLAPGEPGTDASKVILDKTEPHATQHGEAKLSPLQKRLGTVTGDPDAATDILDDTGRMQSEGRAPTDPDFWLDSQSDGSEYEERKRRPKK
jgi:hypothetical protein